MLGVFAQNRCHLNPALVLTANDPNTGQIPLSLIENHINLMPRRLHQWQDPHTRYHQLTNDRH